MQGLTLTPVLVDMYQDPTHSWRQVPFKKFFEKNIKLSLVESHGAVKQSDNHRCLPSDEEGGSLHHKPGTLSGTVPRFVPKLERVTLQKRTPEKKNYLVKEFQDQRRPSNSSIWLKISWIFQGVFQQRKKGTGNTSIDQRLLRNLSFTFCAICIQIFERFSITYSN